ncbi:hypothetical protein [Acetobacter oeni]|uniref:Uncharacterized protein n=1 Tax=Acetobacter oeni TaxID=304077 RepID=A0A511XN51_9PROT|nr:hypothetical protein [Acetobacter oeni]MBB3884219.1 hypothetical protein [Acetobacter oeni]NHO20187.1 hypothetical protein [Acetobacter oeni]GBR05582.1 hypothetical protein AA21952_1768 [Acetobacter oeni LMG 21952]GEN64370.1 hypothetical protein AOE01nite_25940 [Acetobacter oeni]
MTTDQSGSGGDKRSESVSLPMKDPEMSGIQLCPVCHGKMRQTAEICPHCGAEKHFGATHWEMIRFTLGGLVLGILFTVVTRAGWAVGAVACAACVTIAFIVGQSRHGHRWLK